MNKIIINTLIAIFFIKSIIFSDIIDFHYSTVKSDYATSGDKKFIISNAYISSEIKHETNVYEIDIKEKSGYSLYILTETCKTMGILSNREILSFSETEELVYDIEQLMAKEWILKATNNYFPNVTYPIAGLEQTTDDSPSRVKKMQAMEQYLLGASVNYEKIISMYSTKLKREIMVMIVLNGEESILYAVYGIWNNQREAEKYGYNKGDKIYISSSKLTQDIKDSYGVTNYLTNISNLQNEKDETVNAFKDIRVQGSSIWTEEEVLQSKEVIYPQLIWSKKEINSSKTPCKDDNGVIILCTGDDMKIPISPDDYSYVFSRNKFIPGAENCPDMETYYDLFCECVEKYTNIKPKTKKEEKVEASQYLHYLDYMRTEMYKVEKAGSSVRNYDNTVYGNDEYPTNIEVNIKSVPTQPYMYDAGTKDRDPKLINKAVPPSTPDYLKPGAKFAMANYQGYINLFHPQSVEQDQGWPISTFYALSNMCGKMFFLSEKNAKGESISDLVKPCLSKALNFYKHVKDKPLEKMSILGGSLFGKDEITFHINDEWKTKLASDNDSMVADIINRTYIGNPNDRNAPYKEDQYALLYEYYYQTPDNKQKEACGKENHPFRIESRGREYKETKKIQLPVTTTSYQFKITFSDSIETKDLVEYKFDLNLQNISMDNIELIDKMQETAFKNILALFNWERWVEWGVHGRQYNNGDQINIVVGSQDVKATKLYDESWNWKRKVGEYSRYKNNLYINGKPLLDMSDGWVGKLTDEAIQEIINTATLETHKIEVIVGGEKKDDNYLARHDAKDWYLKWRWPLVIRDRESGAAVKKTVGWVRYKIKYMSENVNPGTNSGNDVDANFPATHMIRKMRTWGMKVTEDATEWAHAGYGKYGHEKIYKEICNFYMKGNKTGKDSKSEDHAFNHHLYIITDGWLDGENMYNHYSKDSKDYHTDQYDVSDRDSDIDKGEAIKDIVAHIAVAEALNLSMKLIHYIATKKKQAIPLYEVAKRIENGVTQSTSYDIAVDLYKVYVTWKKVMDLLAEVRDTYKRISSAWNGLKIAGNSFIQYYKDLDYKELRLSNISKLLPAYQLYELDMSLANLDYCITDFENAVDAFAFYSDIITKGNYGPLKPFIWVMTNSIKEVSIQTGGKASKAIERNTQQLDNINQKSQSNGGTSSRAAYLSNITAGLATATDISELRVRNNQVKAMATALAVVEREAKDQLEFKSYMMSLPTSFKTAFDTEEEKKRPFVSLYNALYHERMFTEDNTRYINNLINKE